MPRLSNWSAVILLFYPLKELACHPTPTGTTLHPSLRPTSTVNADQSSASSVRNSQRRIGRPCTVNSASCCTLRTKTQGRSSGCRPSCPASLTRCRWSHKPTHLCPQQVQIPISFATLKVSLARVRQHAPKRLLQSQYVAPDLLNAGRVDRLDFARRRNEHCIRQQSQALEQESEF
jgi:hypothetical protein